MAMTYEWWNVWMHKEWQPMPNVSSLEQAGDFLQRRMPHSEDGSSIREVETGKIYKWTPPRETISWGPF